MRRIAVVLVGLLCACAAPPHEFPTDATVSSASPAASPVPVGRSPGSYTGPYAVLVAQPVDPRRYMVAIVSSDGRIVASATGDRPSARYGRELPKVSTSRTAVYYLDGDAEVKMLRPDGTVGNTIAVPGNFDDRIVFAVDPEDRRVAVTVAHFGPPPPACPTNCEPTVGFRLYVEDLRGPAHVDVAWPAVLSGYGALAYPVGWRNGILVTAMSAGVNRTQSWENPYAAYEFPLIDVASGRVVGRFGYNRSAPSCETNGPLVSAGAACYGLGWGVSIESWEGSRRTLTGNAEAYQPPAALAPGGSAVAIGTSASSKIVLLDGTSPASSTPPRLTGVSGTPIGWIDDRYLVFARAPGSVAVLDASTLALTPVDLANATFEVMASSTFFAMLPSRLE